MQPSKPKESNNDDSEFKAQRQAVIAEASKAGTKKTFGGGSKTLVDSNVQKIMDKGYSEEQATTALKWSRNNVEKALHIIKKREEQQNRANSHEHEPREDFREKRGKHRDVEPAESAKPSGGVSLFDFLENKIPTQAENTKQAQSHHEKRFENNMSSSFRKTDNDFPSRGYPDHKPAYNKYSNNGNARGTGRPQQRDYRGNQNSRETNNSSWEGDNRKSGREWDGGDNRKNAKESSWDGGDNRKNNRESTWDAGDNRKSARDSTRDGDHWKGDRESTWDSDNRKDNGRKPAYNSTPRSSNSGGGSYNNREPYSDNSNNYNSAPNRFNSTRGKPTDHFLKSNDYHSGPSKYRDDRQSDYADNKFSSRNDHGRGGGEKPRNRDENLQNRTKAPDARLNTTNYPPLTPAVEPPKAKTYPKQAGYLPIAGFQSKEANESARIALQTKNLVLDHQMPKPMQPPPNYFPQAKMVPIHASKPPPPFPERNIPQPFAPVQQLHHAMGAMTIAAPIQAQMAMPPPRKIAPPPGMAQPQFKCGDFCLAKYWEDGQVRISFAI